MKFDIKSSGLTPDELSCHDALMTSFDKFLALPQQHPDEVSTFALAVHEIQGLLAIRIARRLFPKFWPVKKEEGK